MSVVSQAVGKVASAVVDSLNPSSGPAQTNAPADIKQAALELVMPKLDPETIAKYAGKWAENVEKDLKEKEEQERIAKEEQQRRQNLGLEKKEETLVSKKEEDKDKPMADKRYSVTDYMELADAVRQGGRPELRGNQEVMDALLQEEKKRLA